MHIEHYRKLVACIVGIFIMMAYRRWGIDLFGVEYFVVEAVISVGTAVAVWWFPNESPEEDVVGAEDEAGTL